MIVIPMAGRSQRFTDAGYDKPKFMLELGGRSVFAHAIESFRRYFEDRPFLFIHAGGPVAAAIIVDQCLELGIETFRTHHLEGPTAGQAETVELGIGGYDGPLTIFNIDTFRPGFTFPGGLFDAADGWLEVFKGSGPNWSYVEPAPGDEPWAVRTAEKVEISDLCCTGLYHFARAADFRAALAAERAAPQAKELYVAPLYNHLIANGARVAWRLIDRDEVVFCGTPQEYAGLISSGYR